MHPFIFSHTQPHFTLKNAMKIFAYNASSKNPRAEHRVNLHIVAKKNENNSLINGIVKKRRSQKLKQPCIEERSDELAGTGAILGESLFLCKSANKQLNFSSFFAHKYLKVTISSALGFLCK